MSKGFGRMEIPRPQPGNSSESRTNHLSAFHVWTWMKSPNMRIFLENLSLGSQLVFSSYQISLEPLKKKHSARFLLTRWVARTIWYTTIDTSYANLHFSKELLGLCGNLRSQFSGWRHDHCFGRRRTWHSAPWVLGRSWLMLEHLEQRHQVG